MNTGIILCTFKLVTVLIDCNKLQSSLSYCACLVFSSNTWVPGVIVL